MKESRNDASQKKKKAPKQNDQRETKLGAPFSDANQIRS